VEGRPPPCGQPARGRRDPLEGSGVLPALDYQPANLRFSVGRRSPGRRRGRRRVARGSTSWAADGGVGLVDRDKRLRALDALTIPTAMEDPLDLRDLIAHPNDDFPPSGRWLVGHTTNVLALGPVGQGLWSVGSGCCVEREGRVRVGAAPDGALPRRFERQEDGQRRGVVVPVTPRGLLPNDEPAR
jgi:hypothetical protein